MANRNFYEILGISEKASLNDIKTHYHKLARLYHPDITKLKNTHDKFIEINEAYRTLKDPMLRKAYDFGLLQSRKRNGEEGFRIGAENSTKTETEIKSENTEKPKKAKTMTEREKLDSFIQKANMCFSTNSMNEALLSCEAALEIDDQLYDMWKMRGEIYRQMDNLDNAMESYSKACKINDTPEIRAILSQVVSDRMKKIGKISKKGKKGGLFGMF